MARPYGASRRPPAGAGGLGSDQHVRSSVAVASRLYLDREDSDIWFGRKEPLDVANWIPRRSEKKRADARTSLWSIR
jgi:hypothetical protein